MEYSYVDLKKRNRMLIFHIEGYKDEKAFYVREDRKINN